MTKRCASSSSSNRSRPRKRLTVKEHEHLRISAAHTRSRKARAAERARRATHAGCVRRAAQPTYPTDLTDIERLHLQQLLEQSYGAAALAATPPHSSVLLKTATSTGKHFSHNLGPDMDIRALLANPSPEPCVRRVSHVRHRSSSNSQSAHATSPPSSTGERSPSPTPLNTSSQHQKRGRHDAKPIWAILEHEVLEVEPHTAREQHLQSRPLPPSAPSHQETSPPALEHRQPASGALTGYEIPITNAPYVYDEMSRQVCDFIWNTIFNNKQVMKVVEQCPGTQVEIEARWGQIVNLMTGKRLRESHATECILRRDIMAVGRRFESTMSINQHKNMNLLLNEQVAQSRNDPNRAVIEYKHTKEVDVFYELDNDGFSSLPDPLKKILQRSLQPRQGVRVRVTRDLKDGHVVRKIIKHRVENLEISSPQTEWDYRIGVNLEIEYLGPIEGLNMVVEKDNRGRPLTSERKKDRMSYSWGKAYQIDLTQVLQGPKKNHELELELDAGLIFEARENMRRNLPDDFEPLVRGMINNLRVLSRQMTVQHAA